MNFAALTKELPQPTSDFGGDEDYIAVLLENGKVTSARAPCSLTNLRFIAKFSGDWRWGKLSEVLAPSLAAQIDVEQLRRLQEQVAAKDAVIARIHEWSAPNR